jgi:ribose 5-phosphate isomerase B
MQEKENRNILAIGADHAGFKLKEHLAGIAQNLGWEVLDLGTHDQHSVDYPDFSKIVCESILNGKAQLGLLICGTGVGMSIGANRFAGIRAALCQRGLEAKLAKQKNHANVLCLGAKIVGDFVAQECLELFLRSEPDTTERHARRVQKLG